MAEYTRNFHLKKLGSGEHMSDEAYKYSKADRELIDMLLQKALTQRYDGAATDPTLTSAGAAPTLALGTGGSVPAGARVYYKYALVDPSGLESAASAEAYIDTPAAVAAPDRGALELVDTAGSLLPGGYYYALTAYAPTSTQETEAGASVFTVIPSGTTNSLIIHLPTAPAGAIGFNIYRQGPGEAQPVFLATVLAATLTYTDDGSVAPNTNRPAPSRNNTASSNTITATLPAAFTPLPAGWTWKLYRTYLANNYDGSLVHWVVEETSEGSGIITTSYTDTGLASFSGAPSDFSLIPPNPDKVDLADGAEVQGRLPLALVEAFPQEVTFAHSGVIIASPGTHIWVCDYPRARIVGIRISVGRGSSPITDPVIVDVNYSTHNEGGVLTPGTYASIFASPASRPRVNVGNQMSSKVVPAPGTDTVDLVAGDSLTVDVASSDSGAGAVDLVVTIMLLAQFDHALSELVWS